MYLYPYIDWSLHNVLVENLILKIKNKFQIFRIDVAHWGHTLYVAQSQYLHAFNHVHGKSAIANGQRTRYPTPICVHGIRVHNLLDTHIYVRGIHNVETQTRRLDEELKRIPSHIVIYYYIYLSIWVLYVGTSIYIYYNYYNNI